MTLDDWKHFEQGDLWGVGGGMEMLIFLGDFLGGHQESINTHYKGIFPYKVPW